jgi:hypothetical protein
MEERMPEPKPGNMEILAWAQSLGLDKAVAGFPEDVLAAAEAAARARGAFEAPGHPADEPWPPMRVEGFE